MQNIKLNVLNRISKSSPSPIFDSMSYNAYITNTYLNIEPKLLHYHSSSSSSVATIQAKLHLAKSMYSLHGNQQPQEMTT